MDLRLRFDLRDTGGPPGRQLRVGDSLVSFGVWAYASDDTGGSTVAVILPPGYDVEVPTGALPLRSTAADGRQVLRSGPIARPATFFAYVVADRPGAYRESRLDVGVGGRSVDVMLRAWREDAAWSKRVGRLLTDALPVLGGAIGLPWPVDQPLVVQEAGNRPEDGFAGLFEPAEGRIEIAYYADTFVVLHEAAHTWFNGSLLADRWANEAFASLYAERAAAELGLRVRADEMTDELRPVAVPLNAWASSGETEPLVERYGYAAALAVARAIRERASDIPCAPCGRPRPRVSPPTSRRTVGPSSRRYRDPTGADCSTCSRSRPARRSTTSGGPGSPGLPTRPCSTLGRPRGRRMRARWHWPAPGSLATLREALRNWQFDTAEQLDDRRPDGHRPA